MSTASNDFMAGGEGEGGKAEAEGEQIEGTQHSADTDVQLLYHKLELPRTTCVLICGCGSSDDVASPDHREISEWGSPI
jgi:hypothetical protein